MVTTGARRHANLHVKLSPPTNQHLTFYRPDALAVAQRTVSSTEGTARRFLFAVIMQSNVAAVSNTTELRRCGILFTVARF